MSKSNKDILINDVNDSVVISRRSFLSSSISIALLGGLSFFHKGVLAGPVGKKIINDLIIFSKELNGFNGEPLDPMSNLYQSGNGYRNYNPNLMRFHSMDSLSPFSDGGINPYVYCHGDPVNFNDPSGHVSWLTIGFGIFAVLTGIVSVILTPFTGGTSLAIGAGIISGASGTIGGMLTIASGALEGQEGKEGIARKLSIASLVFGCVSIISGGVAGISNAANNSASTASKQTSLLKFKGAKGIKGLKVTKKLKFGKSVAQREEKLIRAIESKAMKVVSRAKKAGHGGIASSDFGLEKVAEEYFVDMAKYGEIPKTIFKATKLGSKFVMKISVTEHKVSSVGRVFKVLGKSSSCLLSGGSQLYTSGVKLSGAVDSLEATKSMSFDKKLTSTYMKNPSANNLSFMLRKGVFM